MNATKTNNINKLIISCFTLIIVEWLFLVTNTAQYLLSLSDIFLLLKINKRSDIFCTSTH